MLPKHYPYDYPIDLQLERELAWGTICNLSPVELNTFREYINENLASGFIPHSPPSCGATIFFVKKKDGSLHWSWIIEV